MPTHDRAAKVGVWAYLLFTMASFLLALFFLFRGGFSHNVSMIALPIWMGYTAFNAIKSIADLIGAAQANEVVFTRNTSESLNLVAKSFAPTVLEPGDEVVITIMEHHSNLIPWQQVCRETGAKLVYLYPTKTGQLTTEEVLAKVGPKTKILAVVQVSNVLGVENPVKNLGKLVHKYGGYLVVDGAQSLPHMPVDVGTSAPTLFIF